MGLWGTFGTVGFLQGNTLQPGQSNSCQVGSVIAPGKAKKVGSGKKGSGSKAITTGEAPTEDDVDPRKAAARQAREEAAKSAAAALAKCRAMDQVGSVKTKWTTRLETERTGLDSLKKASNRTCAALFMPLWQT